MFARLTALLLVLALAGPSVAAMTCEVMCALNEHHRSTPTRSESSCHEHNRPVDGVAALANLSTICHESSDLPSAVIDAVMNADSMLLPIATTLVAPSPMRPTALRSSDHDQRSDPRPTNRPLRV